MLRKGLKLLGFEFKNNLRVSQRALNLYGGYEDFAKLR